MNDGNQAANFLYLLLMLVLVGSALVARRLPIKQSLKLALIWALIFALLFGAIALRHDFAALWRRIAGEATGTVQTGQTLRIKQAEDGHFWISGTLNGEKVRFLIDSGASTTSLGKATAARAGIQSDGGFPVMIQTANGVVGAERGIVKRLVVGPVVRDDMPVHFADAFGDTNVLGMDFLSSLTAWGVEGDWLVLTD